MILMTDDDTQTMIYNEFGDLRIVRQSPHFTQFIIPA